MSNGCEMCVVVFSVYGHSVGGVTKVIYLLIISSDWIVWSPHCKLWQELNIKLLGWTLDLAVLYRLAFPCQLGHKQNYNPKWVTTSLSLSFFILRWTSWTRCWGPSLKLLSGRVVSCTLKIKREVSLNIVADVVSSIFHHKSSSVVSRVVWREKSLTISK